MEEMDRKDVGILAMDIYFPPTCVQQVNFFPLALSCACLAVSSFHVYKEPSLLRAGPV